MKHKIVFTGGGTAGHVIPNIALIEAIQSRDWQIDYIGSATGLEKPMIESKKIPFHFVSNGKLRRYFSLKNFVDPFKIILGIIQSYFILGRLKTELVFSKGGFVAFPVVVAAWLHRIPVIAHESDLSPGLANRLSFPFVKKVCITFPETRNYFKNTSKVVITGTPIRKHLYEGNKERAMKLCGFDIEKPCILVVGGSLGSETLNKAVRESLNALTDTYQIIHLCGTGKIESSLATHKNYKQFEFARGEMADFLAAADIVISRSGANALFEILALAKPHILIPLSKRMSRGDQIQNARYFENLGISSVIYEDSLNTALLLATIKEVQNNSEALKHKMKDLHIQSADTAIVELIDKTLA